MAFDSAAARSSEQCAHAEEKIAPGDLLQQFPSTDLDFLEERLSAPEKLRRALACFRRAITLEPDGAPLFWERREILFKYLAGCLGLLGDQFLHDHPGTAVVCHKRALALTPASAEVHYHLGVALSVMGNRDEALGHMETAVALKPDNCAEVRYSLSMVQLALGNFSEGWRNYEFRYQRSPGEGFGLGYDRSVMRAYPLPLWKGTRLASGRLLIWGEHEVPTHGVGDEILFASCIPDVIRAGNRFVLECEARLKPLFARSFPGVDVVSGHTSARDLEPDIAAHLPLGSLPSLFRVTDAAFAAAKSPYLVADPVERERFRTRYADGRRLVGLAWHSSLDMARSIVGLSQLAPLFALPGVRWVSLQYGKHSGLEDAVGAANAPILIDRSVNQFVDFDLFAAQVAAMDMVVTIDNSTAHLAGALGVPTYLLLPCRAHWYWTVTAGEKSLWYPSMRLFRQPRPDDWQPVVERVNSALEALEGPSGA